MLGRRITEDERVHHINEDRTDNRRKNLRLYPDNSTHQRVHKEIKFPGSTMYEDSHEILEMVYDKFGISKYIHIFGNKIKNFRKKKHFVRLKNNKVLRVD